MKFYARVMLAGIWVWLKHDWPDDESGRLAHRPARRRRSDVGKMCIFRTIAHLYLLVLVNWWVGSDVTKHDTGRTDAKYRSWVLVTCVWCSAYYLFRLRKGTGYGFHAFLTCILLLLLLIQCKISLYVRCGRCGVSWHPVGSWSAYVVHVLAVVAVLGVLKAVNWWRVMTSAARPFLKWLDHRSPIGEYK